MQEDAAVESSVAIERSSRVEQKVVERSSLEFWLPLLCILVLASFLRLYALSIYPQRFNQDEMLLGYDAWNIWTTGHDHHGAFLPIFFRSYNDYNPPVANYIAAPFVGILGLNEFSTRLPFALMGIVTIFLVALLGRLWFNSATGLVAALLLTIDPWYVNFSRVAFPSSCVPFFTVVSLYCFTRGASLFATKAQRCLIALLWLVGSALSFALLTGSYSTMKLEAPLLLCACAIAVVPFVLNNLSCLGWTDFLIWLALYGLLVSPLAIAQLQDWYQIQARFNHLTIINQPNWLILFLFEYINSYSLYLLSFAGFGGSVAIHPQGVGNLFWLEGVLFIFALIGILKNRYCSRQVGFSMRILLVVWLMAFPIASSLTIHSPHDVRTYNFLPLPEILAGYGAVVAWDIVGRYRWLWFSVGMVVLKICNFDLYIYHLIYIAWVFSTIFPLFYTVLYFTRSRVASIFSIVLFSTFAELVQCDAHFFAIRQASLPFLACFVYFFFVKKQAKLSQVFLSLFSFCLITNFLISLGFGMTLCLYDYRKYNISMGERIKKYARTCWIFVLLTGTYFGLVALIPHSLSNLLAGQKVVIPYLPRLRSMIAEMPVNGPNFLFGGLGIMFCKKDYPLFSILSILTFLISMFAGASFFTHYIATIAVPFAIMGGLFINRVLVILSSSRIKIAWVMKIAWICIVFFYMYIMVFSYLYEDLITQTTPNVFQAITVLEKSPEPLFTLQPTYALYAHKNLVMYYNTADIRVFFITGTNLSYEEYHTILNRSNTVLLEPLANYMLPEGIKKEILQKYYLKYSDGKESIYIRKTLTKTSTP